MSVQPRLQLLQPARLTGREDRVREQPARARFLVHLVARRRHLLVGQKPILLDVRRCRRDQRDLGVAVEKHLLLVVRELQILDRLLLAGELLVPAGFPDRCAHVDEGGEPRVVAQEVGVHVHDELVLERIGALLGHVGGCRLGLAHIEQRAVDLIHRHERGRHAGRGLEELAAVEPLLRAEIIRHRQ